MNWPFMGVFCTILVYSNFSQKIYEAKCNEQSSVFLEIYFNIDV